MVDPIPTFGDPDVVVIAIFDALVSYATNDANFDI
jgi:hypothetical protein